MNLRVCLLLLLTTLPFGASHAIDLEGAEAWLDGRAVILMRHALAPGTGDPVGHVLDDCSTQRDLSDAGRAQARLIGERLSSVLDGSPVALYSSEWCRCRHTAEALALGPVTALPALNSFFNAFDRRAAQTAELAAWIELRLTDAEAPPAVLVSHQVNISALTGQGTRSGELQVVTMQDGRFVVLGTLETPVP